MKLEQKLVAALIAALLSLTSAVQADDKDKKYNEPAGAEAQAEADTKIHADAELEIDDPAGAEKDLSPEKFLKKAHQSGLTEVAIGQLAVQRGDSSSVKQFGDKLARDHKEANQKMEKIAERKNITITREIEPKYQEKITHLTSLSGEQFDREFIKHTAEHHRKDIKTFEKQAREGEDPAIRSFASETLPVLRAHLKIAEQLQQNRNASIPELREPAGAERPDQQAPEILPQEDDDDAIDDAADTSASDANNNSSSQQP